MLFFRLRLPTYRSCDCMIKYVPLIMFRRAEVLVERTWFVTSGLEAGETVGIAGLDPISRYDSKGIGLSGHINPL